MYRLLVAFIILFSAQKWAVSQETFHPNGVADQTEFVHAFTNAKIYTDYKTIIEDGTLLIKGQLIVGVGTNVTLPKDAIVHDMEGKTIYPSFIELYSNYGMPEIEWRSAEGYEQFKKLDMDASGWNMAIRAEANAVDLFKINDGSAEEYRNNGFGAVLSSQNDGIVRGTSVLVDLDNKYEHHSIIKPRAAMGFSFERGSSPQDYPWTQMGSIALLKQTYLDADWYKEAKAKDNKDFDATFEAFNEFRDLPKIFEVADYIEELRADKLAKTVGVKYIIKGIGDEYKRIGEIKKCETAFMVPLKFPKAYDVRDPYYARMLELEDMKHWELAPSNAAKLEAAQINFVFTSDGLKKKGDFLKNIRRAIQYGLSEETALKAITYGPAELINATDKVGALKKGMRANFIISKGNLFGKDNVIYENWVGGSQHMIKQIEVYDARGKYSFVIGKTTYDFTVDGKMSKPKGNITINDSTDLNVNLVVEGHNVTMDFEINDNDYYMLAGSIDFKTKSWVGVGKDLAGEPLNWSVAYVKAIEEKDKEEETAEDVKPSIGDVWYPNRAYGFKELPTRETTLIKNATVWTNEKEGILENTDVLLQDGKIAAMGKDLKAAAGVKIIDATGKQLTVGIIDEHVHFALRGGLNEDATSCSAEVKMGDIINPDDYNIYPILSGGVTTGHLLHGSSNLIGGQSEIIKLRWGRSAEEMVIKGRDQFIKFALGENVTGNNNRERKRLPGSGLGMEGFYRDYFSEAVNYKNQWKAYNALSPSKKLSVVTPRRNLRLETLESIVDGNTHITCHSYVQSGMMMLMHVADDFGFKVNTFTHGMEAYKIADELKKRGTVASIFSDWWGYKMEAQNGIPQAAGIFHELGVITCFNTDIAYQSPRLYHDVAKAIKYAGLPDEEAWKIITLNPAKALHLDDRLGSVKVGKDADVVIWDGHPMSIYTKVEKTFIDGIIYYDKERDLELRAEIKKERDRLIKKMIWAKENGEETQMPKEKIRENYSCHHR